MRSRPLRLLLRCAAVTVVASTIAVGFRYFYPAGQSTGHSDSVTSDGGRQPEKATIALRAHTRRTISGAIIRLQWNPSAEPIRRSSYAMLYIYDGPTPRNLALRRQALQAGFLDYSPETGEVTFHLVLQGGGRLEGQSLLVVFGAGGGTPAGLGSDAHAAAPDRVLNSPEQ